MLIERASEYGIRIEAVRFDIPFCPYTFLFRPSSTSFSSSGHLLSRTSVSPPVSHSFLVEPRATRARLRRHCMRIENDPSPRLTSPPPAPSRLGSLSSLPLPSFISTQRVYVIPIIRYKALLAYTRYRGRSRAYLCNMSAS